MVGGGLPQYMLGFTLPRCGPEDINECGRPPGDPLARPLKSPPWCGPGDPQETCKAPWDTICKACWDTTPGDMLQGMLGYYHPTPPWTEFLKHAAENISLPKLRLRAVIKSSDYKNHPEDKIYVDWDSRFLVGGGADSPRGVPAYNFTIFFQK